MPRRRKQVLIGPRHELHPGIHGSLLSNPPSGIRFLVGEPVHVFLLRRDCQSRCPFGNPHYAELIDFGSGREPVYSTSWPVLNRRAWISDLDNFGYPMVFGRHILSPKARSTEECSSWSNEQLILAQERTAAMLSAYSHPSCKAVLLYTKDELLRVEQWLRWLELEQFGKHFLRKCRVVRPAQNPCGQSQFNRKWLNLQPLRIVFCGHDFAVKNGAVALDAYEKIRSTGRPVELVYIGDIPRSHSRRHRQLLDRIEYYNALPRSQILSLFRRSHILFHPSRSESYGMVMVEAAAMGMAIVSARRGELALSEEFFGSGGALLLDAKKVPQSKEAAWFSRALCSLLDNPFLARRLARRNHRRTTSGRFSVSYRNSQVMGVINRISDAPRSPPLTLDSLRGQTVVAIRQILGRTLVRLRRSYCKKVRLTARNVIVSAEWECSTP